jgi:hypothetical protein
MCSRTPPIAAGDHQPAAAVATVVHRHRTARELLPPPPPPLPMIFHGLDMLVIYVTMDTSKSDRSMATRPRYHHISQLTKKNTLATKETLFQIAKIIYVLMPDLKLLFNPWMLNLGCCYTVPLYKK